MLVTKESSNIYLKSNINKYMGHKINLHYKYEEVYNQALVLTCISMKPALHPQKL